MLLEGRPESMSMMVRSDLPREVQRESLFRAGQIVDRGQDLLAEWTQTIPFRVSP